MQIANALLPKFTFQFGYFTIKEKLMLQQKIEENLHSNLVILLLQK